MTKGNNRLKGYRVMAGFTQEDFSKLLNVTRVTYLSKENRNSNFSFSEKEVIYKTLKNKLPDLQMEALLKY